MPSNQYSFVTFWTVPGHPPEDVYDLLVDIEHYPSWWPQVYLNVRMLARGGPDHVGDHCDLLTKGKLPYKLRWQSRTVSADRPRAFTIKATGDFIGQGVWSIEPDDAGGSKIRFDWNLIAEKPLIRALSFIFKPIFAANHRWAMARGEEGLRRQLSQQKTAGAPASSR